jgi:hypoxanthine-guanine phosphoribosyltransferase
MITTVRTSEHLPCEEEQLISSPLRPFNDSTNIMMQQDLMEKEVRPPCTLVAIEFIRAVSYRHRTKSGPPHLLPASKAPLQEQSVVVGRGLDFNEEYRQLPGLCSLSSKGSPSP